MSRFNHKMPPGRAAHKENAADPVLQQLLARTPAQGAQWIEDNVNSLAEAKQALKFLAKAVIALSHDI